MAFPTGYIVSEALASLKQIMLQIKSTAQAIQTASNAGPIGADRIISYVAELASQKDRLALVAATPGLAVYAQEQYDNINLDIVAEYNTTLTQINDTITWIITNFPKSATNELLEKKFDANGRTEINTFSTVALSTFRDQLQLLINSIG